jgi:seryl-tRNA synthetase
LGTATSNSKHPPERLSEIKNEIIRAEREQKSIAQLADSQILTLPNIPDEVSLSVTESFTIREVKGSISPAAIAPHWDIAERLGYADSSRATKISGGGFLVLMNDGAKLLRQLRDLGVELLRSRYREVSLPHLVREESMYGSGHLPKFSNGSYKVSDEPLWLSPTAEVPLTSIHRNETIPVEKLTLRYVSALTCFRREVGNGGAASQWRLHEYDQVELMRICTHGAVEQEYSELLQDSTKVLDLLDITYRVVRLSPIDLPFSASRAHRIDVYSPGTQMWLPVSSASLFSDYQARRSNIRIKDAKGTTFATTMNSSALAASRLWGILLENGLQKDGTVMLPAALHERMGTNVLLPS